MTWSFRLARVSGIDVRVHASFLLVVVGGAFQFSQTYGSRGAVFGALLVCLLFVCVTLHELGHSLVAQRFGVGVLEIMLLPIGGVARLLRQPKTPGQEFWIAIAGPLVNAAIAALLCAFLRVHPVQLVDGEFWEDVFANPSPRALFTWLLLGNGMLAVFNMLPALPMDGGRVLRALLSYVLGHARATRAAAFLGQLIAAGFIGLGFVSRSPVQVLIGLFVFVGAGQERLAVRVGEYLAGFSAGEVCDPHAMRLSPDDSLGAAIDQLLRSAQAHFAVVQGGALVGTLSRDEALSSSKKIGLDASVAAVMQRDFKTVTVELSLEEVRARLLETGHSTLVVRDGEGSPVLGVIGLEDLQRIADLVERLAKHGVRRLPSVERQWP